MRKLVNVQMLLFLYLWIVLKKDDFATTERVLGEVWQLRANGVEDLSKGEHTFSGGHEGSACFFVDMCVEWCIISCWDSVVPFPCFTMLLYSLNSHIRFCAPHFKGPFKVFCWGFLLGPISASEVELFGALLGGMQVICYARFLQYWQICYLREHFCAAILAYLLIFGARKSLGLI